jgi:hypothetical protein
MNDLIKEVVKNGLNENDVSQVVFLYFKDKKTNIEKIRIAISEEIFELFMNVAEDKEICLKLKDAKFKDKIMKSYITKNKFQ